MSYAPKVHKFVRVTVATGSERYEAHRITNLRADGSEWCEYRVWDTVEGGNGYVASEVNDADAARKARSLNRRWARQHKSAHQR